MGFGSILGAVGGALANPMVATGALGGASSAMSYIGQKKTNEMNRDMAVNQMNFQERMSNTAYQRSMKDMRKAGLNPILAGKLGGASTPGGAMPVMHSELGAAAQGGMQGITTGLEAMKTEAQTGLTKAQTVLTENLRDISESGKTLAAALNDVLSYVDQTVRSESDLRKASEAARDWIDVLYNKAKQTGSKALKAFEAEYENIVGKYRDLLKSKDPVDSLLYKDK